MDVVVSADIAVDKYFLTVPLTKSSNGINIRKI